MRGEPNYHKKVFEELYAKLDVDNNDEVSLEEMI